MAISDEQFSEWLKDQSKQRIVLAEFNPAEYPADFTKRFRVSNYPYLKHLHPYDDVISNEIYFRRSISEKFFGGASVSFGEIVLTINEFIEDLIDFYVDNQPIQIFIGDKEWEKSDFRLIVSAVIKNKRIDQDKIILSLRDDAELLDTRFPRSQIVGGEADGEYPPLLFGRVDVCEPLLIDASISRYRMNAGATSASEEYRVWDSGVEVAYSIDTSMGYFTLTSAPSGKITFKGSGIETTAYEIVEDILSNYANIDPSKISTVLVDIYSLFQSPIHARCGLYITNDNYTMRQAIDDILSSFGIYWFFSRLGKFTVGRIGPASTNTNYLFSDEIKQNGMRIKRIIIPEKSVKLGYARRYIVQDYLAASLTQTERLRFSKSESVYVYNNSAADDYPNALDGEIVTTEIATKAAVEIEAERRSDIVSVQRIVYEIECLTSSIEFELGQEITVFYNKYGFDNGLPVTILSINERIGFGQAILEVMR